MRRAADGDDSASEAEDTTPVRCSGEVWTDARGYATVALPRAVRRLHGNVAYELRPFTDGVVAEIAAELMDGRFTIATDEPHVKVAWRVTGLRIKRDPQPGEGHREAK